VATPVRATAKAAQVAAFCASRSSWAWVYTGTGAPPAWAVKFSGPKYAGVPSLL